MKTTILAFCLAILPLAAKETTGACAQTFAADVEPGAGLTMHLRSGEIRVMGTDESRVVVTCGFRDDDPALAHITWRQRAGGPELDVHGGPDNNFHVTVQVPRKSNLFLRVPAGEVKINGVVGHKDVELHAGELDIEVENPASYAHVDASVWTGEIDAAAFGVNKGGFFRSWSNENRDGKYRLHAHVGAGELRLTH
jgi:hypothetical protein